jgi:hypothetical protein
VAARRITYHNEPSYCSQIKYSCRHYFGWRSCVRPFLPMRNDWVTAGLQSHGEQNSSQTSCSTVQTAKQTRHPIPFILFTCTLPPHASSPLSLYFAAPCNVRVRHASAHAHFPAWPNSLAPIISSLSRTRVTRRWRSFPFKAQVS